MALVVWPTPITALIPGDALAGIAIVKLPVPSTFLCPRPVQRDRLRAATAVVVDIQSRTPQASGGRLEADADRTACPAHDAGAAGSG